MSDRPQDQAQRILDLEAVCDDLETVNERLRVRVWELESLIAQHIQKPRPVQMRAKAVMAYLRDKHNIDRSYSTIRAWMRGRIFSIQGRRGSPFYTTPEDVDRAVESKVIPPTRGVA